MFTREFTKVVRHWAQKVLMFIIIVSSLFFLSCCLRFVSYLNSFDKMSHKSYKNNVCSSESVAALVNIKYKLTKYKQHNYKEINN